MSKREREQRRRKRRQDEAATAIAALRAAGKSCGNCESFEPAPFGMKGHICDLFSEFSGYQTTTADSICHKHKDREPCP